MRGEFFSERRLPLLAMIAVCGGVNCIAPAYFHAENFFVTTFALGGLTAQIAILSTFAVMPRSNSLENGMRSALLLLAGWGTYTLGLLSIPNAPRDLGLIGLFVAGFGFVGHCIGLYAIRRIAGVSMVHRDDERQPVASAPITIRALMLTTTVVAIFSGVVRMCWPEEGIGLGPWAVFILVLFAVQYALTIAISMIACWLMLAPKLSSVGILLFGLSLPVWPLIFALIIYMMTGRNGGLDSAAGYHTGHAVFCMLGCAILRQLGYRFVPDVSQDPAPAASSSDKD